MLPTFLGLIISWSPSDLLLVDINYTFTLGWSTFHLLLVDSIRTCWSCSATWGLAVFKSHSDLLLVGCVEPWSLFRLTRLCCELITLGLALGLGWPRWTWSMLTSDLIQTCCIGWPCWDLLMILGGGGQKCYSDHELDLSSFWITPVAFLHISSSL